MSGALGLRKTEMLACAPSGLPAYDAHSLTDPNWESPGSRHDVRSTALDGSDRSTAWTPLAGTETRRDCSSLHASSASLRRCGSLMVDVPAPRHTHSSAPRAETMSAT